MVFSIQDVEKLHKIDAEIVTKAFELGGEDLGLSAFKNCTTEFKAFLASNSDTPFHPAFQSRLANVSCRITS